jgi:class 3 adenylate cyclase
LSHLTGTTMKKLFFLCFILWTDCLCAQTTPISIYKDWKNQIVESNLGVLPEIPGQALDTAAVTRGLYDTQFKPYNTVKISGGLLGHWLHLVVDNSTGPAKTLYLGTNRFDYIDFWWRVDSVVSIGQRNGQLIPDDQKPVGISGLSFFSFRLPAERKVDIYLKVAHNSSTDLPQLIVPITLMDEAEFHRSYKRPTYLTLMFLGAVGIMVVFNLMLFFITGLRAYLFYTGYVVAMTLFDLAITPQFAMQMFGHMDVTRPYVCTAGQAALSMYILVARELTESPKHFPRVDRMIRYVLMALVLAVPLAFWEPTVLLATVINFTSALSVYPPLISIAIIMTLRGHLPSRYFLLATAIFIIGDVVMILQLLRVLPPVLFGLAPSTYVQIGVAVELALFSLGLGARIQEMRKRMALEALEKERILREREEERKRILEEQNTLLEMKVRERTRELAAEKEKSEGLLLNILPIEIADELKQNGRVIPRLHHQVSIVFLDIVRFTTIAESIPPEQLIEELDYYFREIDTIFMHHNVEKIKTIGDAYLAVSGLPMPDADHAEKALLAAKEIMAFVRQEKAQREPAGRLWFDIRVGIHSGSAIAGVVGNTKFAFDVWGDDVNIAARLESSGEKDRINVSSTTWALLKDRHVFEQRGKIQAKYKGELEMYFLTD